jgi:hypothetical protein
VSVFQPRWQDWEPKGPIRATDKTDKRASVSFVSTTPIRIPVHPEAGEATPLPNLGSEGCVPRPTAKLTVDPFDTNPTLETGWKRTDKTDKSPSSLKAALLRVPDGVPLDWGEGVVKILAMPGPEQFSDGRWQILREDAHTFLKHWAVQAHGLGWTTPDLFGVHRHAPLVRFDALGLVPLLDGCRVAALTEDGAAIVTRSGARQTFRRHQAVVPAETCLIWDLGGNGPDTLGDVA